MKKKHEANLEHMSCACILNTFALSCKRSVSVCIMSIDYVVRCWSCYQQPSVLDLSWSLSCFCSCLKV